MIKNDWPFNDPPNKLVFTLKYILEEGKPILNVYHENDGDWQFQTNIKPKKDDGVIVTLEKIIEFDESVKEIADLKCGWHAWRKSVNEPWNLTKIII